jgi:RNA polymerase sigma-70 factor (ECF subfamily)
VTEWGRDEIELVRRCREGSDAAYAALVSLHRPRLFKLAYRLTGDRSTAEEVVQEAFLAAFQAIDKFEPKPSLAAWLNRVTVRIAGRAASKAAKRPRTSLDAMTGWSDSAGTFTDLEDLDPSSDPHVLAETAELRRAVEAAIDRLPFKFRAAVILRHVTGLDYAEAALALDVPLNTYRSHLLRGTRLLREDLADRFEAPASFAKASSNGGEATEEVAYAGAAERATRT